jgi:hypothetical protein
MYRSWHKDHLAVPVSTPNLPAVEPESAQQSSFGVNLSHAMLKGDERTARATVEIIAFPCSATQGGQIDNLARWQLWSVKKTQGHLDTAAGGLLLDPARRIPSPSLPLME